MHKHGEFFNNAVIEEIREELHECTNCGKTGCDCYKIVIPSKTFTLKKPYCSLRCGSQPHEFCRFIECTCACHKTKKASLGLSNNIFSMGKKNG